ncbi:MAG: sialidase family protein [Ktedonobacteraceae bacterium]
MMHLLRRPGSLLLILFLLLMPLCSCSLSNLNTTTSTVVLPNFSLAGGGRCVKLGFHPRPPYTNIRVSNDSYQAHSETMGAEDPNNPLHLVSGAKFFPNVNHYRFRVGYATSLDGGCTWTDGGALPGFEASTITSDPSFAFGPHHEVYASVLYLNGQASGVAVATSRDNGKTFGHPVSVFQQKPNTVFSDKPWIAVDQTRGIHSGNVYVVWSYDHGNSCGDGNFCSQELAFSRSTDGGKTFSPARLIEGNASFCTNPVPGRPGDATRCDGVVGAIPALQPDGTIVVATPYIDVTAGATLKVPTRLIVVSSHDGGNTWSAPLAMGFVNDVYGTFPPEKYRNETLPAFACDPRTGQLYIAWSDKGKRDADILFATSKDNGQTWSLPVRVNDDPLQNGANQFQPQMVVAPDGVISISFFDTRRDPQHRLIDVYLAQSINHGASFLKNVRVTTQSWDPAVKAPLDDSGLQFIGDYQGLAADNLFVHPFWNDTRTGDQELFTAVVPSAQP